jgi:beta-glucosidase
VDDAVRRILIKKFELGLFDDPYRFSNNDRQNNKPTILRTENSGESLEQKVWFY